MFRHGFRAWGVPQMLFEEPDAAGAAAAAAAAAADDKVVTMAKTELEALIKGRVAAATLLAKRKAEPDPEVEAMRKRLEEIDRQELEKKGQYDAALKSQEESIRKEYEPKLTAAETKAKTAQEKLEERVVGLAVSDAAGKMNAVNPTQVRLLLAHDMKMNDSYEAIVVDEHGSQRFVAGKPMTPEQRVKEFLDQNPHMVRSTAGAGGGAGGGKSLVTGDVSAIQTAEAKVKTLADEALRSGTPKALIAHAAAVKELARLKAGAAV